MIYRLSKRSLRNMERLHPDLVDVVHRAIDIITAHDFGVQEKCWRSLAEQQAKIDLGYSHTARSKHLIQADGYSHAVDLVPWDGRYIWDNPTAFKYIADAMFQAAIKEGVDVRWGGFWTSLNDSPHWELR